MFIVELFLEYKHYYITGIKVTLLLSFLSLIAGVLLGTFLSLLKMSKYKLLSSISTAYIEVFRGTPMMVQTLEAMWLWV